MTFISLNSYLEEWKKKKKIFHKTQEKKNLLVARPKKVASLKKKRN